VTAPVEEDVSAKELRDLGLGRVVANAVRGRFINRDGTPSSHKYGLGAQRAERAYLAALAATWPQFLGWSAGLLLLTNGVFAMAYRSLGAEALVGGRALHQADPFLRALAFSVGTFTTGNFTGIDAATPTAVWLALFQSLVGIVTLLVIGGLIIARLTRPRMQLLYSESAVVAPYEDGRGLMFRMVNARPGELSDVRVRVILIYFVTENGRRERAFRPLELERESVELFNLHWTVVHPITAKSPLAGFTPEQLREAEAEIIVSVNAHEDTFSTRVRQRMSYRWDEVRWDAKFASIFTSAPDGIIAIDVERLSRTEPLEDGATSKPAPREALAGRPQG
jgi:inward rectifier potassium channel